MTKTIEFKRKIHKNEDGTVTMKSYIEELFESPIEYEAWISQKKSAIASKKNEIRSAKARMKFLPDMDSRKRAELLAFAKKIKESSQLLIPQEAEEDKKKYEEELKDLEHQIPEEE